MDWKYLFTSFEGRIGRKSWWLGTIAIMVIAIILYFVLSAVMGTGIFASMDPEKILQPGFMEAFMKSAAWQQLISLVLLCYPITAMMSKRLNDRDRPSWMKWVFWAPTVLSTSGCGLYMDRHGKWGNDANGNTFGDRGWYYFIGCWTLGSN